MSSLTTAALLHRRLHPPGQTVTSFILGDKIKGPTCGFKITIHNHPSTQCYYNLWTCV